MEKDNVKENETEVNTEEKYSVEVSNEHEENANNESQNLSDNQECDDNPKESRASFGKVIFANFLDQLIIVAGSSVILLVADLIIRIFGYQFVREGYALVAAVMCIYFVINCFYEHLMEKTKFKKTIAKKMLNL